ncbi:hypothetical protein GGI55_006794 [Rhizobium leguminosarum]|nr:hypothetical protein Kim5_PA00296 [Rhizobium sp. Kim5]MBB4300879.1 hypothetical protein [Rhizobium leguminosarum]MBB4436574.1 hypothetical protein [Rhizobium esperanzae]MBB4421272.1 hypothetical protein [Rhizobium leguminosarum]MBB4546147.1 hypothetical protein [Rhizobium leguminosarum]
MDRLGSSAASASARVSVRRRNNDQEGCAGSVVGNVAAPVTNGIGFDPVSSSCTVKRHPMKLRRPVARPERPTFRNELESNMLCLGLSGGLSKDYENSSDLPSTFMHDGAAVPVRDGRVIAAVEEERLNRIKHSNKLPTRSIQYCLASAGVHLSDIDRIAYYATEAYCNAVLERVRLFHPSTPASDPRLLQRARGSRHGRYIPVGHPDVPCDRHRHTDLAAPWTRDGTMP